MRIKFLPLFSYSISLMTKRGRDKIHLTSVFSSLTLNSNFKHCKHMMLRTATLPSQILIL